MSRVATMSPTRAGETLGTGTPGIRAEDLGPVQVENAREMAPSDARELSRHFFRRLQSLEEGTREYQYTRNTL
ncbi:RNA polymerase sigma factor SigF, partial [Streptomyces erythrochromogenes]